MNELAFLHRRSTATPKAVRLFENDAGLVIQDAIGDQEIVSWWQLFRAEERGTTHLFRRIGAPGWELRVNAGSDRELLSRVGSRRLSRMFARLHQLHAVKAVAGSAVLLVTLFQHLPADWAARTFPASAERRLAGAVLGQNATHVCSREGGGEAFRKLLVALDPRLGPTVQVTALDYPGYTVTSLPGRNIAVLRGAMTEFHELAIAALLAHELAHIRRGDPMTAVVRRNGFLGTWGAILQADDRRQLLFDFSAREEAAADLEAMAMMRRAGIPLARAAELFEDARKAEAGSTSFAIDQRRFHFGLTNRAAAWRTAAGKDPIPVRPLLNQDEADAIYNYCWPGQILQSEVRGKPLGPTLEGQPGAGGIGPGHRNAPVNAPPIVP